MDKATEMHHVCRVGPTGHSNGEVFQSNVKIYSVYTHPIALILHMYEHLHSITVNAMTPKSIVSHTKIRVPDS